MLEIKCLDKGYVRLVDSMPRAILATYADVNYIDGEITLKDHSDWGSGDARVVEAARVSYAKRETTVDGDKRLLRYLYTNKHWSPFEQVKFTFAMKLPIFVARQLMRHRTFQFNEVSARYTEVAEEFYFPELARMQSQATGNKQCSGDLLPVLHAEECLGLIDQAYHLAFLHYRDLIRLGLSRELARMVLPVGQYTELFCSVDLRNLLHFIALRDHSHAQLEIQCYAKAMRDLAKTVAPFTIATSEGV